MSTLAFVNNHCIGITFFPTCFCFNFGCLNHVFGCDNGGNNFDLFNNFNIDSRPDQVLLIRRRNV